MSVATELSASGLKICVLESGGVERSKFAEALKKVEHTGFRVREESRERIVGGTSYTWAGQSAPLDPIDFEPRPDLPAYSGWPITKEDIAPFMDQAARRYRFPSPDLFETSHFISHEEQVSWRELEPKVFLKYHPPIYFAQEFGYAFNRGNLDLIPNATVTKLVTIEENGERRVREAIIQTPNRTINLRARAFVLATGAIENARILLHSECGNEHDQVGRYLMNHPKGYIGQIRTFRPLPAAYLEKRTKHFFGYAGLRLREDLQRKDDVLNSYVRLEADFPWTDSRAVAVFRDAIACLRRRELKTLLKILPRTAIALPTVLFLSLLRLSYGRLAQPKFLKVRYFLEMEPRAENRVTLAPQQDPLGTPLPHVLHGLSERDVRSLSDLKATLLQELSRLEIGELMYSDEDEEKFRVDDTSHYLGTTRMGNDAKTSVVDPNLRVHSAENLFVAGGSVFPTSGNINPTMVMVALSIRLAKHLREKYFSLPVSSPSQLQGIPVLIIGAGKRVKNDVLPVLESLETHAISRIFARKPQALFGKRKVYEVSELDELDKDDIAAAQIVYVAIPRHEVSAILRRLLMFDCSHIDLVLSTPVVGDIPKSGFKNIWVEEDSVFLPWLAHVPEQVVSITFDRSAYRYHAVALAKKLCGGPVRFGIRIGQSLWLWCNGVRVRIVEPRDYAKGQIRIVTKSSTISDVPFEKMALSSTEELELFGPSLAGDTIINRMYDYKRVGLRRLLQGIAKGTGWPLAEGENDARVHECLQKYGIYFRAGPAPR
jgi:choline dehydrogenase-like flavoprotein